MGLSKKLGGTTQKLGLPESNAVPYKWSNQTYTVEEILKKFKLPCVVQCVTDSCTVVWSDFQFDLRQPLLFYSRRSAQKIHAVSLNQNNEALEQIGPPLAIPEDYEGWFGAAPKGLSKAKRHFRIEGVANSMARRFLVTTKCPAFTSSRSVDGHLTYVPHDVMPGEVLKRVCVMETDADDPDCPELIKQHGPCLECLDEKDEDIVIPLSHTALTYEICETYPDDESRIFHITSPIEAGNVKLPRILTLIHGDPPLLAYAFTGMIRCYSVFTEETILAATLEDPGSRCLELATDSCVKFRLGLNEAAVKKTCEYASAFQICENFGTKFVTGIKVSFTLKPEVSNTGDVDLSFYESASDMQEVEANSEFEIAWGSVRKARLAMASDSLENKTNRDSSDIAASGVELMTGEITQKLTGEINQKDSESIKDDLSEDDSEITETEHRDFTEQEIVDLMLKKGLLNSTEKSKDAPLELDLLQENRVTDNPLFYFFQRNPEENPWKSAEAESDRNESLSDESQEESDRENPLLYLFQQAPVSNSSKSEVKNPLSYLFEQNPGQEVADDKSDSKVLPDKNINSPLASSHLPDLRHCFSGAESDTDVSYYDQVVRKAARVYTGNEDDDDDDDDEEDDDEEEDVGYYYESESYSEISEFSDDTKELHYIKGKEFPLKKISGSTRLEFTRNLGLGNSNMIMNGSLFKDINNASCLKDGDRALATSVVENSKNEETTGVTVSDEETQAVDDLLTLAEIESNKDSRIVTSGNPKSLRIHENFISGNTKNQLGKNADGEAVHRLNSLLDEVSELVNTSSGRILDNNKSSLHLQQDKTLYVPTTRQDAPLPIPRHKTKRNGHGSTLSDEGHTPVPSSANSSAIFDEDTVSLASKLEHRFDNNQLKRGDRKSKLDNMINFYSGLNKPSSDDSMGVLRRSHVDTNLADTDKEKLNVNFTTSDMLQKTAPSEPSISSIFSVVQKQRNRFDSSNVSYHPQSHGHPHRESSEVEDLENELTSSYIFDKADKYSFPYKNQRILSLTRGNIMAPVQNLERSSFANDSMSSDHNSSLDNSFPNLTVVRDTGVIIEDNSFSGLSAKDVAVVKARPNRLTRPQEEILQFQNEYDGLQEDYV